MTERAPPRLRRRLYNWHSWLGLKLSIYMAFVLITGTFAVLSPEIDWLLNPEMRASTAVSEEPLSLGEQFDVALVHARGGRIESINRRDDAWFATEFVVLTPWQERVRLWVDPYSGEFLGYTGWFNVQRFLRQTHRHLMLPVQVGVPLVSVLGIVLLVSLVSGLVVYRGFWRGFFKRPRWSHKPRVWLGDLHRLIGIWSLWFVALMALTSVWYLVESLGAQAPPIARPAATALQDSETPGIEALRGVDVDAAVAAASAAMPDLRLLAVRLPADPAEPLKVEGQAAAILVRQRANSVWADAAGEVHGSVRGETLSLYQRISEAADPLHFGTWGGGGLPGLSVRVLWFLFGALMSFLSVGGILIYGSRIATKLARDERVPA